MNAYSLRSPVPEHIHQELSLLPLLIRELLYYRNITTKEAADRFLNPVYERDIHDAFKLKDMDKAVERILKAIRDNEKIMIYSDYDADGIPGGVIVHDFFKKIGFLNFENYFPHRYEEGYGLHVEAVEKFASQGVKLVITIDCGISDVAAVEKANELGIDVIITDHHLSQEAKIPPAYAIVNPKQADCLYPYRMLCGSGVVFKLIQALLKKNNFGVKEGMEKWFLDMVGLATMADMVPLRDENRVFAFYGLKVLRKTPRLGLRRLLEKSKVNRAHLSEDDIGFTIAPRINAASRMGKPSEAFELLTALDEAHAETMADYLNHINDERKGAAAAVTKEVHKIIKERFTAGMPKVLVIGNPHWKPALLGPVANNLVEKYKVPVFLWGRVDGSDIKGSCRSDGRVNVLELMKAVPADVLLGYGGHKMSGGFSVSHEHIHRLEAALNDVYDSVSALEESAEKEFFVDKKLTLDEVNWTTYAMIEKLAPFGIENEKPLFLFENVILDEVKQFGKEKNHLEVILRNSRGNKISAIGFFMNLDHFGTPLVKGEVANLIASFEKSLFKSYPELRLRIVAITK